MRIAYAVSWDDSKKGRMVSAFAAFALLLSLSSTVAMEPERSAQMVSVIVRELPGAGSGPERLVEDLGGKVRLQLGIIDGFSASVPADAVDDLLSSPAVHSVTEDRPIKMLQTSAYDDPSEVVNNPGSLYSVAKSIKARDLWREGATGKGVDVALVDTGIFPVDGLNTPEKITHSVDFSFDQFYNETRFMDGYGHGTHLAGIIAGKDAGAVVDPNNKSNFMGIAPDAGLVNVKAGNGVGAADVSQVIAGIDWVVTHKNDYGLNIRVLNLSFGTDGTQDYRVDPLAYAAEKAWHSGLVVVVAAGNTGVGDSRLNNPAYDPYVLAVGGVDTKGTFGLGDDTTPEWTERGDGIRNPDVVAPGKSVTSLRVENSHIDLTNPGGRHNTRFFKGTGTSQAAAVVSGAAALLLSQRPGLTNDQVKFLLKSTAEALPSADPTAQGNGLINVKAAGKAATPSLTAAAQNYPMSDGTGLLEGARGSHHVYDPDGNILQGEIDIFGTGWSGTGWSGTGWSGTGWSSTGWSGTGWSGTGWSGTGWSGTGWSGTGWSGTGWSGTGWSGTGWSGTGWSGTGWSGTGWS